MLLNGRELDAVVVYRQECLNGMAIVDACWMLDWWSHQAKTNSLLHMDHTSQIRSDKAPVCIMNDEPCTC